MRKPRLSQVEWFAQSTARQSQDSNLVSLRPKVMLFLGVHWVAIGLNQKNLRVYLLLYLKGRPISEAGQWASRASERGCVLGWSFSLLTAPSHSLLPCLPLRDMASSGVYKLDDGKPYLSNCFPAKSLLRMPEEGQVTSHFGTFASPPGPASECLWCSFLPLQPPSRLFPALPSPLPANPSPSSSLREVSFKKKKLFIY